MDQRDNERAGQLIKEQDEDDKDVDLGPAHLEKTISKKQGDNFLPQEMPGINRRRKDRGTKATESRQQEYKRDDISLEAEFKKKRDKIFEQQDIEAESLPEASFREEIKYQREANYDQSEAAYDARDGLIEFRNLANGGSHFTFKEDDDENSGRYPEPSDDNIREEAAREKREKNEARKAKDFTESQTYKGKRLGSQSARHMR